MDTRRLQLLLALSRLGSMRAVAESYHLTTSTVSQQISALAKDTGAQLIEPEGRRVRLTPAGERLADRDDVEGYPDRRKQRRDPDDRPGGDRGQRLSRPAQVEGAGGGRGHGPDRVEEHRQAKQVPGDRHPRAEPTERDPGRHHRGREADERVEIPPLDPLTHDTAYFAAVKASPIHGGELDGIRDYYGHL